MANTPSPRIFFLLSLISFFCLDQFSKWFSFSKGMGVLNTGISFGLFSSSFLTLIILLIIVGIAVLYGRTLVKNAPVISGVFFAGSLSNVADRVLYGGVRDFLPIPFTGVHNNLADWGIVLSLGILLWRDWKKGR